MRHRFLTALGAAFAVVLVLPTAAQAAPPLTGSWSAVAGAGSGGASWETASKKVTLRASAGSLPSGDCETIYFDWKVPSTGTGHHDVRAVRTCQSSSTQYYTWVEGSASTPTGVHKLRVCSGPANRIGSCVVNAEASGGVLANWSRAIARTCVSWSLRSATGAVSFNSGGDPRRCDA